MAKRLGSVLTITSVAVALFVAACGDDDDGSSNPPVGGSAGDSHAGAGQAGDATSGSGGSSGSSNVAGSTNGGTGGGGGATGGGGAGGSDQGGMSGEGGVTSGGADQIGGASGAGGEGGQGGPDPVMYACGSNTIVRKLCSATASLNCADEPSCIDCATSRNSDRDSFTECPACLAAYDKGFQCAIDAFESGNAATGLECVEGYGGDLTFDCYQVQEPAFQCQDYIFSNPCPETWPLP